MRIDEEIEWLKIKRADLGNCPCGCTDSDQDRISAQIEILEKVKGSSPLLSVIARDFAVKLATDMLTVADMGSGGVECTRAQMMLKQADGTERNMGGRNKESLVRLIEYHLMDRFGK